MAEATELQRSAPSESLFGHWLKFAFGSVGSKILMAVSGIYLVLFICGHLAGNLLIYVGRDTFDAYAAALHHNPILLWGNRLAMVVLLPLHFVFAVRTWQTNNEARPTPYAYANNSPARAAAKTMILSGLVVAAFFVYHIAHFTLRLTGPMPAVGPSGEFDPYTMVVMGFSQPLIAGFYVLGVGLLAAHLSHGIYSMFQHLGLWGRRWTPWLKNAALVLGYGLCLAFISIPLSVFFGLVKA